MILTVPSYAKDCTNQNLLVLMWLMKRLSLNYPDIRYKDNSEYKKDNPYRRVVKYFSKFGFYPKDIRIILQSKADLNKIIKEQGLSEHMWSAELTGYDSIVEMRLTKESIKVELTDQKCIELICYLSGCLNNNLIEEDKPMKYFTLDSAVKGYFSWQAGWNEDEDEEDDEE